MIALLDTQILLWALLFPESLSQAAIRVIEDHETRVLVSAASAWEIATKVRLGKLEHAEMLERNFIDVMGLAGYEVLAISVESALRAGRFTGSHKDPFDRMIAAQAITLDIPVISSDAKLDLFGVRRIW